MIRLATACWTIVLLLLVAPHLAAQTNVLPDGTVKDVPPGAGPLQALFYVQNNTSVERTYDLTLTCALGFCSTPDDMVTVEPHSGRNIVVTYWSGDAEGTNAHITLEAYSPNSYDDGYYVIHVTDQ